MAPRIGARRIHVVDGVDEQAARVSRLRDLVIDGWRRRGNDESDAVEIRRHERPIDDGHPGRPDLVADLGRNHGDVRAGLEQRAQLSRRDGSTADDKDSTSRELEKNWKQRHDSNRPEKQKARQA